MTDLRVKHVAFPWYKRKRYARVRAVMADGANFTPSFDEWLKQANAHFERVASQGLVPHRIDIDPDQFLAWCTAHNVDADGKARLTFAQKIMVGQLKDQR